MTKSITLIFSFLFFSSMVFGQVYNLSGEATGDQAGTMSAGTASISGTYDSATGKLSLNIPFSGLTGTTTVAHIHLGATGMNGGPIVTLTIPAGVSSGVISGMYVLPAANEADFLAGNTYLNIHSSAAPPGEIRAQVTATAVVVPTMGEWGVITMMLLLITFAVVTIRQTQLKLT